MNGSSPMRDSEPPVPLYSRANRERRNLPVRKKLLLIGDVAAVKNLFRLRDLLARFRLFACAAPQCARMRQPEIPKIPSRRRDVRLLESRVVTFDTTPRLTKSPESSHNRASSSATSPPLGR